MNDAFTRRWRKKKCLFASRWMWERAMNDNSELFKNAKKERQEGRKRRDKKRSRFGRKNYLLYFLSYMYGGPRGERKQHLSRVLVLENVGFFLEKWLFSSLNEWNFSLLESKYNDEFLRRRRPCIFLTSWKGQWKKTKQGTTERERERERQCQSVQLFSSSVSYWVKGRSSRSSQLDDSVMSILQKPRKIIDRWKMRKKHEVWALKYSCFTSLVRSLLALDKATAATTKRK